MPVVAEREQLPVAAARSGDAEAWSLLFKRYQLPLYAYAYELVRDEQICLDLVQETFVSAVRHLESLRDDAKFGSWLFGIAHQKCVQHWRRRSRQPVLENLENDTGIIVADFEDSPLDSLMRREQEAEFMELLNQLPLPQRSVLLLHYLEEFSLEEIAGITVTPLGTVKSRLHYAKRELRKLFEKNLK